MNNKNLFEGAPTAKISPFPLKDTENPNVSLMFEPTIFLPILFQIH